MFVPARMCVYHGHAWCQWKPEEGVISLGIEVTDGVSCHVRSGT